MDQIITPRTTKAVPIHTTENDNNNASEEYNILTSFSDNDYPPMIGSIQNTPVIVEIPYRYETRMIFYLNHYNIPYEYLQLLPENETIHPIERLQNAPTPSFFKIYLTLNDLNSIYSQLKNWIG